MKTIFKKGDRVFDIRFGWGKVVYKDKEILFPIGVQFDDDDDSQEIVFYTNDGKNMPSDKLPLLSFTEYTLQGFSQERSIDYDEYIGKWGKFNDHGEEDCSICKLKDVNYKGQFVDYLGNKWDGFEPLTDEQVELLSKITRNADLLISEEHLPYQSNVLSDYAQVFIDHFGKRFNSDGHFFEVEIIYSEQVTFMKFKVIPQSSEFKNSIRWDGKENEEVIHLISELGYEDLDDESLLQKGIRGMEAEYFYVARFNQYKYWQPIMAYLDMSNFIHEFFKITRGD